MRSSVWYIDNRAGSRAWLASSISPARYQRWILTAGSSVGRTRDRSEEKQLALLSFLCARSGSRSKRRALPPLDDSSPRTYRRTFQREHEFLFSTIFLPLRVHTSEGAIFKDISADTRQIIIWANSLKIHLVASRHVVRLHIHSTSTR